MSKIRSFYTPIIWNTFREEWREEVPGKGVGRIYRIQPGEYIWKIDLYIEGGGSSHALFEGTSESVSEAKIEVQRTFNLINRIY